MAGIRRATASDLPLSIRLGIQKINSMTDEEEAQILKALSDVMPSLNSDKLSGAVSAKVSGIDRKDIRNVIDTLLSFYMSWSDSGIPIERFVDGIINGLGGPSLEEILDSPVPDKQRLHKRISSFLWLDSLRVLGKSAEVRSEYERIFHNARILTDIRPIFSDDPASPPSRVVVVNLLRINYHGEDDHGEFFVAMDMDDLKSLKEAVERAIVKNGSVKMMLDKAQIGILDVE